MNKKIIIEKITALEILDSRGNPTIEVTAYGCNGMSACAKIPSGASTGVNEAYELRDNDSKRYNGLGVLKAVNNVNTKINEHITKRKISIFNQLHLDEELIKLDGTENKSKLGANAILGVSMAVARLAAKTLDIPLYKYIGGINATTLPTPMLNILNGGKHADNSVDFQEFMIVPLGFDSFRKAIQASSEIYKALAKICKNNDLSTLVGDEGGFGPNCNSIKEALEFICIAIEKSGYIPSISGERNTVAIAIDSAASGFYETEGKYQGKYYFKKQSKFLGKDIVYTSEELLNFYVKLTEDFPIISLEDPFTEDDFKYHAKLTEQTKGKIQIVGDDLFVTNIKYIKKGVECNATNSVLIKLNQIGTLTETLNAIEYTKNNNMTAIISHRSGETEDTFIADLAIGTNTGMIKTGSMSRTDRISKYNRILKIESEFPCFKYLGIKSFYSLK